MSWVFNLTTVLVTFFLLLPLTTATWHFSSSSSSDSLTSVTSDEVKQVTPKNENKKEYIRPDLTASIAAEPRIKQELEAVSSRLLEAAHRNSLHKRQDIAQIRDSQINLLNAAMRRLGVTRNVTTIFQNFYLQVNMAGLGIRGTIPSEIYNLTLLVSLDMSSNQFSGTISPQIGNLPWLQIVSFSKNQLSGTIPTEMGKFPLLLSFAIESNQFSGTVPSEFGLCPKLQILNLVQNSMIGTIPTELGKTDLRFLFLYDNRFNGPIPSEIGRMKELATISAARNGFTYFPTEIYNSSKIAVLSMLENPFVNLTLPTEMGLAKSLSFVTFETCYMSSSIPTEIGLCTLITSLYLSTNALSGSIPSEIGLIPNLADLFLGDNQLAGSIPNQLYNLTKLGRLWLYRNQLSGTISPNIGNLKNLKEFSAVVNRLSGTLPTEMMTLPVRVLELLTNKLSGTIPTEIGLLAQTEEIRLDGNDLTGTIPTELGNAAAVKVLGFSVNSLSGTLPSEIGKLKNLNQLYIAALKGLSGSLPTEITNLNLNTIDLSGGRLTGNLQNFCNMSQLVVLNLAGNYFTTIPSCLSKLSILSQIYLNNNLLTGTIPLELNVLNKLNVINLRGNKLTNLLTLSRGLTTVIELDLSNNMITGEIELPLSPSLAIKKMYLNNNQLQGTIPKEIFFTYSPLDILDISRNNLSGSVPKEIFSSRLISFDASYNNLSGDVGQWLNGTRDTFMNLVLSGNKLTGNLKPTLFARYTPYMRLENNLLDCIGLPLWCASGELNITGTGQCFPCQPVCGDGIRLDQEDCDDGNKVGGDGCSSKCKVESDYECTQSSTQSVDFLQSNPSTCRKQFPLKIVLISTIIPIFLLCILIIILYFVIRKLKEKNDFIASLSKKLDIQNNFMLKEEDLKFVEVIGEGNFGKVHLGSLNKTTKVAIKEVKQDVQDDSLQQSFLLEAKLMASIHPHPNIVQFLGVCISRSKKALFIVTQYVPNKSLQQYVYQNPTSLVQKKDMFIGIAAGMHHLSRYSIVHNDLAARNILLEETVVRGKQNSRISFVAKVSDFGLAKSKSSHQKSESTVNLPVRWAAPEIFDNPDKASMKSDVWSFGVVMWEIANNCSVLPYPGLSNDEVVDQVRGKKNVLKAPKEEDCPICLYKLMTHCWKYSPDDRPSFDMIHDELTMMTEDELGEDEVYSFALPSNQPFNPIYQSSINTSSSNSSNYASEVDPDTNFPVTYSTQLNVYRSCGK